MRVAVTGANGFIGRDLCQRLARDGHQITAVVRREADALARFGKVVRIDLTAERDAWAPALRGAQAVVHLAGRAHQGDASDAETRADFWQVNVDNTRTLLECAAASGVEHLLFMSSVKVFGERSALDSDGRLERFTNSAVPRPQGPYGESKLDAERVLEAGCRRHGMQLTILRPPLVYGPGATGNLHSLLKAIQRGIPLPFASIDNRRSLVHRANLNDAIVRALCSRGGRSRIYTLADLETSTPALIRLMAAGLSCRTRLWHFPVAGLNLLGHLIGRAAAISRLTESLVVDSQAITNDLGWRPAVDPVAAWAEIGHQFKAERA